MLEVNPMFLLQHCLLTLLLSCGLVIVSAVVETCTFKFLMWLERKGVIERSVKGLKPRVRTHAHTSSVQPCSHAKKVRRKAMRLKII